MVLNGFSIMNSKSMFVLRIYGELSVFIITLKFARIVEIFKKLYANVMQALLTKL